MKVRPVLEGEEAALPLIALIPLAHFVGNAHFQAQISQAWRLKEQWSQRDEIGGSAPDLKFALVLALLQNLSDLLQVECLKTGLDGSQSSSSPWNYVFDRC